MKNKVTITRGEGEGDNGGKKGKSCQGTCVKDTWTKLKGIGSRVGGGDRGAWRGQKWRRLYLNNNKKN